MKQPKFKVGDKVRCIKEESTWYKVDDILEIRGEPFTDAYEFGEALAYHVHDSERHSGLTDDNEVWIMENHFELVEEASQKPVEWFGEGLPPVGTVCEVAIGYGHDGDRVRIVAHDDGEAVGRYMSGELIGSYASFVEGQLIPPRTAEQIAADERKNTIKKMMEVYGNSPDVFLRDRLGRLYDAGLRFKEKNESGN